ncbi:MAG: hypothetical protein P8Y09_11730, partial [Deltaproteobacteria bacterium]
MKKGLLLYGDSRRDPAPTDELLRYAERYMEDEGYSDALNFYFAAGSEDGVKNILSTAVSTGDFFLYRRACEMMGWETNRDDLM